MIRYLRKNTSSKLLMSYSHSVWNLSGICYLYMYTYLRVCVGVCIYLYRCIWFYVYTYMYVCIYGYMYMHVWMYIGSKYSSLELNAR